MTPEATDRFIHAVAAVSGLPVEELRASLVAPPVPSPAPECPPWCVGGCGWQWISGLSFTAWHEHAVGSVHDVTVVVSQDEAVTVGDLPRWGPPAVVLCGDLDAPFTVADTVTLAGLLCRAGDLLQRIERGAC